MYENIHEFIRLAEEAVHIRDSKAPWKMKYDLIFSPGMSRRMHALVPFEYYDPDTSYEEDVRAFCRAVEEKAEELRLVLG